MSDRARRYAAAKRYLTEMQIARDAQARAESGSVLAFAQRIRQFSASGTPVALAYAEALTLAQAYCERTGDVHTLVLELMSTAARAVRNEAEVARLIDVMRSINDEDCNEEIGGSGPCGDCPPCIMTREVKAFDAEIAARGERGPFLRPCCRCGAVDDVWQRAMLCGDCLRSVITCTRTGDAPASAPPADSPFPTFSAPQAPAKKGHRHAARK